MKKKINTSKCLNCGHRYIKHFHQLCEKGKNVIAWCKFLSPNSSGACLCKKFKESRGLEQ
jgi:hypothetical protein